MAGLADVAKITHVARLSFGEVDVCGISLGSLGQLVERFPEFRKLASTSNISVQSLIALGPEFVSAFLAAGTSRAWTNADEVRASQMSLDDQAQLLLAIIKVSMPRGTGPFVETVISIMTAMGFNLGSTDGKQTPGSIQQRPSSPSADSATSQKKKRSA